VVDKRCKTCGAPYRKGKFYKCEECGDIYCHNCAHNYSEKERIISESVKKGDKDRYIKAVCPSCDINMNVL